MGVALLVAAIVQRAIRPQTGSPIVPPLQRKRREQSVVPSYDWSNVDKMLAWGWLERETEKVCGPCRSTDYKYVKQQTSQMGYGSTMRSITASRYPGDPNFWLFLHSQPHFIIDLTSHEDQEALRKGNVQPFYPEEGVFQGEAFENKKFSIQSTLSNRYAQGNSAWRYEIKGPLLNPVTVERRHFPGWPDGEAIEVSALHELVEFSSKIKAPLYIHCVAGRGRTGTLITALILYELAQKGKITRENFISTLMNLILDLRWQRDRFCVTTSAQFDLLWEYGEYLLTNQRSFETSPFPQRSEI